MPKEIFRDKNDFVLNAISKYQKIESENKVAYLSPSSIHDLLQCDLRFYFKKIEKIKEPDVILKTEMSPFDFGKWVHGTIQNLYEEVGKNGRFLQKSDFETMKSKWEVTQFLVWNALEEKASDGSLNSYYYEKEIGKVMAFRFFDFMSLQPAHRWIRNEMDMEKNAIDSSKAVEIAQKEETKTKPHIKKLNKKLVLINATEATEYVEEPTIAVAPPKKEKKKVTKESKEAKPTKAKKSPKQKVVIMENIDIVDEED